jgi:hypothetical protein
MSLANRARAAADALAADQTTADSIRDQDWYRVLRVKLRTGLACLLSVDPPAIGVRDDPVRRWGAWAWPLLEYTDPDDGRHYAFTCKPANEIVLALGPCPACGATVPVARIAYLADLLAHGASRHFPIEFYGDPGHDPGCQHRVV